MRPEEQLRRGAFEVLCAETGAPTQWLPTDESVVNPQNPYALSKHAEEQIAIQLGRRYGIPSVAMRYSIVQGPGSRSRTPTPAPAASSASRCTWDALPRSTRTAGRSAIS
jgi:nucleoside-diphosphate-sugar epimerase